MCSSPAQLCPSCTPVYWFCIPSSRWAFTSPNTSLPLFASSETSKSIGLGTEEHRWQTSMLGYFSSRTIDKWEISVKILNQETKMIKLPYFSFFACKRYSLFLGNNIIRKILRTCYEVVDTICIVYCSCIIHTTVKWQIFNNFSDRATEFTHTHVLFYS